MASKKSAQHKQKLNITDSELILAYDATLAILEAWATALDLRHKEAKGHTLRVMEMTLSLAKAMEVSNQELVYIRYGALLHDVGNMTVPESILFKQGELTADEWVAIHMHPYNAYEMLQSISFLRPALDIPYYHHEKWDGTGYPRGLRGEQIPLAARMFSIVDVWVALTSNRPYRPAWSEDKALDYIRKQSGIHFDPKIVNLTLERGILSR